VTRTSLQAPLPSANALEPTRHLALASLPRLLAKRPREFHTGELIAGTRYRVTRLLGTGGMGRVYEVEHVELGKRFVLKALRQSLARRRDLVARLRTEWRALARLDHRNIVSVTDAGTSSNGVTFYVMERLEGETLAALLLRQGRLLPQVALAIAIGVLDGLSAAHRIGVVHRDVKPPNVFLIGSTRVKLLDFGIAKVEEVSNVVTARGTAVGTPRYMSPEQAHGIDVDARSDIYAAGLILFEMLSGSGPFDDVRDPHELCLAQLGRQAPLLSSISVVAPELDRLVASMLAKDPRERPSDAASLARQLRVLARRYDRFVSTEEPTVALPSLRLRALATQPAATLYGVDTWVDSITSAPTVVPGLAPLPTEVLTGPALTPTAAGSTSATRTAVPAPGSVPGNESVAESAATRRPRVGFRLGALCMAGVAVLVVAAVVRWWWF
jgi:serine/threonine-protein kinase